VLSDVFRVRESRTLLISAIFLQAPGGDRGIRTPDLRDANAALSQLSYIPSSNNKDYNIYPPCQSVTLLLY
jgi:hypothetical protein